MTCQDLGGLAHESSFDLEDLHARLRKMTDAELIRIGKDCAFLCGPRQNFGT
jgi:hypothetical protein